MQSTGAARTLLIIGVVDQRLYIILPPFEATSSVACSSDGPRRRLNAPGLMSLDQGRFLAIRLEGSMVRLLGQWLVFVAAGLLLGFSVLMIR